MPNNYEINEDEISKNKCSMWILGNVFFLSLLKKIVGPVKNVLGLVDPRCYWSYGPVTVSVSVEACKGKEISCNAFVQYVVRIQTVAFLLIKGVICQFARALLTWMMY